jgi:hypothetical protein
MDTVKIHCAFEISCAFEMPSKFSCKLNKKVIRKEKRTQASENLAPGLGTFLKKVPRAQTSDFL